MSNKRWSIYSFVAGFKPMKSFLMPTSILQEEEQMNEFDLLFFIRIEKVFSFGDCCLSSRFVLRLNIE